MIESLATAMYLTIVLLTGLAIAKFASNISITDDMVLTPQLAEEINNLKTNALFTIAQGTAIVFIAPWMYSNPLVMILMCIAFTISLASLMYIASGGGYNGEYIEDEDDDDNDDNTPTGVSGA